MHKQISDIHCKGRVQDTQKLCGAKLYQSDGEFIYINGLILNPDLNEQLIKCDKCGYGMHWQRNSKYISQANKNNTNNRRQWRKKLKQKFI